LPLGCLAQSLERSRRQFSFGARKFRTIRQEGSCSAAIFKATSAGTARSTPGIPQNQNPNHTASRTARRIQNGSGAASRVRQRRDLCDQRARAHDAKAVFWQKWAAPLAWGTAVLAALSALAVVANVSLAAMVLSILAAIAASTVAGFQPSDIAKSHRAAATAYERLARKLDDVEALDLGDCKEQIPVGKIDPVRTEIAKLEEELNSIELSHPPVSSFKDHQESTSMEPSYPPASNFKRVATFH
jgi:hypothetical protein